jgi:hypothetical protein
MSAFAMWSSAISVTTAATITGGLLLFTVVIMSISCALEVYHARHQQEENRVGAKEHAAHNWATTLGAGRAGAILSLPYNMFSCSPTSNFNARHSQEEPAAEDELVVGVNPAYLSRLKALFTAKTGRKDEDAPRQQQPSLLLKQFVLCPETLAEEYTTVVMSPLEQQDVTGKSLPVYLPTPPFQQAVARQARAGGGTPKQKYSRESVQAAGRANHNKLYTVACSEQMMRDNSPCGLDQVIRGSAE